MPTLGSSSFSILLTSNCTIADTWAEDSQVRSSSCHPYLEWTLPSLAGCARASLAHPVVSWLRYAGSTPAHHDRWLRLLLVSAQSAHHPTRVCTLWVRAEP